MIPIWSSMKPAVKITIVVYLTIVSVAAMITGYFDEILNMFGMGDTLPLSK